MTVPDYAVWASTSTTTSKMRMTMLGVPEYAQASAADFTTWLQTRAWMMTLHGLFGCPLCGCVAADRTRHIEWHTVEFAPW